MSNKTFKDIFGDVDWTKFGYSVNSTCPKCNKENVQVNRFMDQKMCNECEKTIKRVMSYNSPLNLTEDEGKLLFSFLNQLVKED